MRQGFRFRGRADGNISKKQLEKKSTASGWRQSESKAHPGQRETDKTESSCSSEITLYRFQGSRKRELKERTLKTTQNSKKSYKKLCEKQTTNESGSGDAEVSRA